MRNRLFAVLFAFILFIGMIPLPARAATNYDAVYQWNLSVYNSKATNEATLAYYRLPDVIVRNEDEVIINLALSITAGKTNDYERIRSIHDWVAENIWYDANSAIIGSAGILTDKRTVCHGYSNLTAALLRAVGIPAKVIAGFALGVSGSPADFYDVSGTEGNHAWNEAFADGRWIILDTTWDSNNKYENGVYSKQATCRQDYFDISLQDISKDHRYLDYTDYHVIDSLVIDNSTNEIHEIKDAVSYKDSVTEIIIPDGVTGVGNNLFQSCSNLRSVTIPQSVKSIGDYAFSICPNLSAIIIPNSVTQIGNNVFWRSPNVVLYGDAGSYAEAYAKEQSLPFVAGTPTDVLEKPSTWAATEVNAAIAAGLVPKSLQSKYTQTITRAEYCALAVALYEKHTGEEITKRKNFNDTDDINVEKMAAVNVVSGIGNNLFDPDANLTREQAAAMLSRLAEAIGKPLQKQAATFSDNAAVSSWAFESVGQVQTVGIMGGIGNNTFAPKDPYTREQSIITMIRLWNIVK